MPRLTMLERFENKFKINLTSGCWEWTACKHNRGYGYFYTDKDYSDRKMDFAHRVSMFLYKGELFPDLCVLHNCDNTCCVNPEHLRWGTHKENMEDMSNKGRSSVRHKLTEKDVEWAIQARRQGAQVKHIAEVLDIDRGYASRLTRGL